MSADDWASQLLDSLDGALSDQLFADFVGTFSGLSGSFDEFAADSSRAGSREELVMYSEMLIQLEALHTLHTMGIRNANRWIADTYIDLSAYGELWLKIDFETGNEYNYSVVNGEFVQVEVGFTPNPPEVSALRQALLAPHTIWGGDVDTYVDNQAIAPMSIHHSSVGRIQPNFSPGPGTGFLVHNRVAATAGHVVNSNGVNATSITFTLPAGTRTASIGWVDASWVQNQDNHRDQAFIIWNQAYTNPTLFVLRMVAPGPEELVMVLGFPSHTGPLQLRSGNVDPHRIFAESFDVNPVSFSDGGMSGGPVRRVWSHLPFSGDTDVIGINSGRTGDLARGRVVRVTTRTTGGLNAAIAQLR